MRRCLAVLISFPLLAGGTGTVTFKQHAFKAEVAVTPQETAQGLMYRKDLPKDRCMMFVYAQDSYHAIWMKNCLISLDVAWVDAEGRVVEVAERVPPCSPLLGNDCATYGGTVPSRHFVEFPVGTFKRLGLKKGDRLGWSLTLDGGQVLQGGAKAK